MSKRCQFKQSQLKTLVERHKQKRRRHSYRWLARDRVHTSTRHSHCRSRVACRSQRTCSFYFVSRSPADLYSFLIRIPAKTVLYPHSRQHELRNKRICVFGCQADLRTAVLLADDRSGDEEAVRVGGVKECCAGALLLLGSAHEHSLGKTPSLSKESRCDSRRKEATSITRLLACLSRCQNYSTVRQCSYRFGALLVLVCESSTTRQCSADVAALHSCFPNSKTTTTNTKKLS